MWYGEMKVSNVEFVNFKDELVSGCSQNNALSSNEFASDNSMGVEMTNITFTNAGVDNYAYFYDPDPDWANMNDCGNWPCTGIRNIIVKDMDGSFTGSQKTIIPNNKGVID